MIQFLVALALCYVLIKIPFWVLGSIRGGGGSLVGGLVRGLIAYKTFGLLGAGSGGKRKSSRSRAGPDHAEPPDPYARSRADSSGQYMLPLQGMKRGRLPKPPHQRYASRTTSPKKKPSANAGKQQALFTVSGEPKTSALPPELHPGAVRHTTNPGEQTMLPIHARHDPDHTSRRPFSEEPATDPPRTTTGHPSLFTASGRARPQAYPPRPGQPGALPTTVRPGEQHHLPLVGRFTGQATPDAARQQQPPEPRTTSSQVPGQQALVRRDGQVHSGAKARPPRRTRPHTPPAYKGIRPDKHGQYALPGVPKPPPRRSPRAEPPPPPEPPRNQRQQVLPLNLPDNGGEKP